MVRGNIEARGGGERRGVCSRQYFVWVVDHEREVGEGTEAFEAAFIGVVKEDWSIIHLFFHEGKAADLSSDGGDCLKGCSKALANIASQFLGCSCCGSSSNVSSGSTFFKVISKNVCGSNGKGG